MKVYNATPEYDITDVINAIKEFYDQYLYYNNLEKELEMNGYYEKIDYDNFNEEDYEIQLGKREAIGELEYIFENYEELIKNNFDILTENEKELVQNAKELIYE